MAHTKRGLSRKQERSRATVVDAMVTYLECSDFVPPVKKFVPVLRDMLLSVVPALHRAESVRPIGEPWEPLGLIYLREDFNEKTLFRFDCCEQVDSRHIEKLSRINPGAFGPAAERRGQEFSRLTTYRVRPDGSASNSIPRTFRSNYGDPGSLWFPVVSPTPISTQRVVTAAGWREREILTDTNFDGLSPLFATLFSYLSHDHWSVRIRAENGRSDLWLFTDEDGATGFFNLRSAPMSGSGARRAAIQHWVNAHTRKVNTQPTDVRSHFRGADRFTWFGFECAIDPPKKLTAQVAQESRS